MRKLTTEQIDRLKAGATLDTLVAEEVMGHDADPVDPKPAPHYSTDPELAEQVLARMNAVMPPNSRIDERQTRLGWRMEFIDQRTAEILIDVTAPTRAAAIGRLVLHFAQRHPEVRQNS
jgi:hypothetical protein